MQDVASAPVPAPRRAGPRMRLTRVERAAALIGLLATSVPVLLLLWTVLGGR